MVDDLRERIIIYVVIDRQTNRSSVTIPAEGIPSFNQHVDLQRFEEDGSRTAMSLPAIPMVE